MGQRELLLMLLASVITALAIYAGIEIFKNQELNFEEDEYSQIMLDLAEKAQTLYVKPAQLGGAGQNYKNLSWGNLGCPLDEVNVNTCRTADGKHKILLQTVDNYHFKFTTFIFLGPHMYAGGLDVKADTAIIIADWRKIR